MEFKNL